MNWFQRRGIRRTDAASKRPGEGMRRRIYIASPLSVGNLTDNINRASAAFMELMRAGLAPFCPAWSVFAEGCAPFAATARTPYAFANVRPYSTGWSDWMAVDLPWVSVSDAVLRLDGESVGADEEVAHAHTCDIPVFYTVADVIRWSAMDAVPTAGPVS